MGKVTNAEARNAMTVKTKGKAKAKDVGMMDDDDDTDGIPAILRRGGLPMTSTATLQATANLLLASIEDTPAPEDVSNNGTPETEVPMNVDAPDLLAPVNTAITSLRLTPSGDFPSAAITLMEHPDTNMEPRSAPQTPLFLPESSPRPRTGGRNTVVGEPAPTIPPLPNAQPRNSHSPPSNNNARVERPLTPLTEMDDSLVLPSTPEDAAERMLSFTYFLS